VRAIRITSYGGPEVLAVEEVPGPVAGAGFELIRVSAAGVNFADTHQTENTYLSTTQLPLIPGSEVVGETADGRRVAALVGIGGYAEQAVAVAGLTFDVPDEVSDVQALAVMVQGLSAWHLLSTCAHVAPGESVVVHAAAGGVGSLAIQLARTWGAGRIIGVASSAEKRALAADLGADATIDGGAADLTAALLDANGGAPVDIVLEMTGGPTFDASLAALAPFGRVVTYGMAGRVPARPIETGDLLRHSRAVIGFWLTHCIGRPGMIREPLTSMFQMIAEHSLAPVIGGTYPLADARRAHEDLLARRTTGKLALDPRS
jgi:NADPH2:quinone reductase